MYRVLCLLICVSVLTGCGGQYILSACDQLAPIGQEAAVVVRLQRNDFFVLSPAVAGALMRMRIEDRPERGAYTDKLGYAGTTVRAPSAPGKYRVFISHTDIEGDEVSAVAAVYVWDPAKPVMAVDLESIPIRPSAAEPGAKAALLEISRRANIIYFTRRSVAEHEQAHAALKTAGYPDGPILLWQRKHWHIVRGGKYKFPRIVVESRLVSQLRRLRKVFPMLQVGFCDSQLAADAFLAEGMTCVVIGKAKVKARDIVSAGRIVRRAWW